ncbi:MAG TPA: GGDEF domain-containing protein, partial [Planctomycetaceae bacterium]|nr:GGDEF domain-containing protein [Planctomycetaceae bacterium]
LVEADRGIVFLISDRHGSGLAPAARIGQPLSAGAEPVWRRHEEAIAWAGFRAQQQSSFDSAQLKRFHVDSLIGSALTIPIIIDDHTPRMLCLTRSRNTPFAAHLQSLLENAVDVFTTVMNRGLEAQEFERQAREDGLTELANRREFDRQLLREVEAVHAQQVEGCCLLLLDLDRFKKVNDDYGHQGGDEVLRITARVLKDRVARIRSGDRVLLARYGGEEMALILPSFTMQGALRVAEQIREAIEKTDFRHENRSIHVTVSIGVASCPLHALNAPDLLEAADTALYQAKARGRNRVCAAIQSPLVESGSGILG